MKCPTCHWTSTRFSLQRNSSLPTLSTSLIKSCTMMRVFGFPHFLLLVRTPAMNIADIPPRAFGLVFSGPVRQYHHITCQSTLYTWLRKSLIPSVHSKKRRFCTACTRYACSSSQGLWASSSPSSLSCTAHRMHQSLGGSAPCRQHSSGSCQWRLCTRCGSGLSKEESHGTETEQE